MRARSALAAVFLFGGRLGMARRVTRQVFHRAVEAGRS